MNREDIIEPVGLLNNTKPNYTLSFHRKDKEIGKLDFSGPKMVFIGDADESVKVFVEAFSGWFEQRIAEEREAKDELLGALQNLLMDTQHAEHDCGDEKYCPVLKARNVALKYDKEKRND